MAEENFASLGKIEAIKQLYEGTPFTAFSKPSYENAGKGTTTLKSIVFSEGIDFDLTYFPLKHLGYKAVVAATGELFAEIATPRSLSIKIGVSSKLDYTQVAELWNGIVSGAEEFGYESIDLDLVPSLNGLFIFVGAVGEATLQSRPEAHSMDLICVSGNLGGAYLGQQVLLREKAAFARNGKQPELEKYSRQIGSYLKPELNPRTLQLLQEAEIVPSRGYLVTRGLADAVKRLSRDSGLGAKVYMDRLPFEGDSFSLGKELGIDPVTAAMNGGEDYRLLFVIPLSLHEKFRRDFQTYDIIGHLALPEVGSVVVTPDGVEFPLKAQGWDI